MKKVAILTVAFMMLCINTVFAHQLTRISDEGAYTIYQRIYEINNNKNSNKLIMTDLQKASNQSPDGLYVSYIFSYGDEVTEQMLVNGEGYVSAVNISCPTGQVYVNYASKLLAMTGAALGISFEELDAMMNSMASNSDGTRFLSNKIYIDNTNRYVSLGYGLQKNSGKLVSTLMAWDD